MFGQDRRCSSRDWNQTPSNYCASL